MSNNMQRFATVMSNRMKQSSSAAVTTTMELGVVNSNLSITPDSLRVPIPVGDYMVNLRLTGERFTDYARFENSAHRHELPEPFRGLKPNDRILIAWCGNEPVVLAIVVSS